MPVTDSLRQLAQRQDFTGVFARTKSSLIQVGDVLVDGKDPEHAQGVWTARAEMLDDLVAVSETVGLDAPSLREFADACRAIAAVIDEADLG